MIRGSLGVILSFGMLFLGITFIFIAEGLLVSSTAVILKKEAQIVTGMVTAALFAGALLCIFLTPRLIAKIGFVRSYAVISAIFAFITLMHAATDNIWLWGLFRVAVGFCYYSIVLIAETWLNARARDQIRSRVLSFYEIVFYFGFGLGTFIMGLDLPVLCIFIIATLFIILGQIPLNLTFIKAPPIKPLHPSSIALFQMAPLALFASICAGFLMNGFYTMAPLYALLCGKNTAETGFFMIVAMAGGLFAHTFCGKISDHIGRKKTILIFDALAFLSALSLCFISTETSFFYFNAFCLGTGISVLYSLALARANDRLKDKSLSVEVGRRLLFCYLAGSFFSPLVIGLFLHYLESLGYPVFNLLVCTALFVFALFQPNIPPSQRQQFERRGGLSSVFEKDSHLK